MPIRPRHLLRWILGGVAVAIALAFAGPYVYIHFVEGEAPAALAGARARRCNRQPAAWQATGR